MHLERQLTNRLKINLLFYDHQHGSDVDRVKALTFTISKGGVGKSLITANVGAAIAHKGKRTILIEGDPNRPLQLMLNVDPTNHGLLEEIVKLDMDVEEAVHPTHVDNLFLVPSGISLEGYLDVAPAKFAEKIKALKADFVFIDTPFPLGKAAVLSLGTSEYFVPILTEDEFVPCVESAIDTIRLGKYYFKCIPIGFLLNRIKTKSKFTNDFIKDLENLLEIPCLAKIDEDQRISKSYGGATTQKGFLAYEKYRDSEFAKHCDRVANSLLGELPKTQKDPSKFLEKLLH
jgi:septum site-determining protein MinD